MLKIREDKLSIQSMDFAVEIINLVKALKLKKESVISNQIGRSGTSIGENIREAQYAHGTADCIAKLQIALKESGVFVLGFSSVEHMKLHAYVFF